MATKRWTRVVAAAAVAIGTVGCCYVASLLEKRRLRHKEEEEERCRVEEERYKVEEEQCKMEEERRRDWAAKTITAKIRRYVTLLSFRRRRAKAFRIAEPLLQEDRLAISSNPVVTGISSWFGGIRVTIDDDGNCWGSAWFLVALLWAIQDPCRIALVVSSLGSARDAGAFGELSDTLKDIANQGLLFVEGLAAWWEGHPSPDRIHGAMLAVRLVRILHAAENLTAKRAIAVMARCLDVWYASIELQKLGLGNVLDDLRTVGNAVDPMAGVDPSMGRLFRLQPGGGLGFLFEMRTECLTGEERTPTDVTASFQEQALAAGDRVAHGVKVLHLGSVPHFDVLVVEGTPLGTALAESFDIPPLDPAHAIRFLMAGRDSREKTSPEELVAIVGGQVEHARQIATMQEFYRIRNQRRA